VEKRFRPVTLLGKALKTQLLGNSSIVEQCRCSGSIGKASLQARLLNSSFFSSTIKRAALNPL
jgi:hypothetical protein